MSILLETSLGDIVVDLFCDEAPRNALNFIKLCRLKALNFAPIARISRGFAMQMGDNDGGASVWHRIDNQQPKLFAVDLPASLKHNQRGIAAFTGIKAPNGTILAGSQFYITLSDAPLDYLDGQNGVFGVVAEGMDVLDRYNETLVDDHEQPFRDLRIKHTIILDDPFPDPDGLIPPAKSPEPTEDMLKSIRLGEDEPIHEEDEQEAERKRLQEEAAARALTLEMVGDLPFAEIKPPENVLFVCKLNSVTRDEDLQMIFSRFGKIISCEIVRDKVTGDSMQYAFIEFDRKEDCEEAYLKMDNVLIDDRRIHVDFSQSVAKLHMGFLKGDRQHIDQDVYGGQQGLRKKTQYRESHSDRYHRYDMVFEEHRVSRDARDKHKSHRRSHDRRSSRSRDRRRSRSRSRDHHRRHSSRDRRSRSRSRDRRRR